MFDLFRFFMLRPPEKADDRDGIPITDSGELQSALKEARAGEEPLAAMREIAEGFVKSEMFVGQPDAAHHSDALNTLRTELLAKPHAHLPELKTLVRNAFDEDAGEVVASETFQSDKTRVHESLLAIKLAPVQTSVDYLALYARLIDLIERTAGDDILLNKPRAVANALTRLLVLPADLFPLPSPLEQRKTPPSEPPAPTPGPSNAGKRVTALEGALAELTSISPDAFARPAAVTGPVQSAPRAAEQGNLFLRILGLGGGQGSQSRPVSVSSSRLASASLLTLKQEAVDRFQPASQAVFRELNINLTSTSTPMAVSTLRSELARARQELAAERSAIAPSFGGPGEPKLAFDFVAPAPAVPPLPPPLPAIHGFIKPVGMADLLVVNTSCFVTSAARSPTSRTFSKARRASAPSAGSRRPKRPPWSRPRTPRKKSATSNPPSASS